MSYASAMHAELHIACATAERQPGRLDSVWNHSGPHPAVDALVAAAEAAPAAERWILSGGEPSLRPDLPALVAAMADSGPVLGMRTDGLLLARPGIDQQLFDAGLRFVRIPLHCGRADAHDWLVRLPGASKRIRQAMDHCAAGPLVLEAEITLTRPTVPYLVETISLLIRHGVGAVHLRLLTRCGPAASDYIALAPRLGLVQPILEDAIQQALRHDLQVRLCGIPLCVAPRFPECQAAPDQVVWALPEDCAAPPAGGTGRGCPGCPGRPRCAGAPSDYTGLFGWTEIQSEGGLQARAHTVQPVPTPRSGDTAPAPVGRAGRAPTTRLHDAVRISEVRNIGGDPMAGRHPSPDAAQILTLEFEPDQPTRVLRTRLIRAAQHGAHTLRIEGASMQHPAAHDLLREAQRLSFDRVEVRGEGSALDAWTDTQLRHLRGLASLELFVHGQDAGTHDAHTGVPGSFAAVDRVQERVARLAGIPVEKTTDTSPSTDALFWTDETGGTTRQDSG